MERFIVWVVSRSRSLALQVQASLHAGRYAVFWAPNVTRALALEATPALIVLELPDSGGGRSVRRLKRHVGAPVLALCLPDQAAPEGIDAALPLASDPAELACQIELACLDALPDALRASGLTLDVGSRRLKMNGRLHELPPTACQILACLMSAGGEVVGRDELFRRVWQVEPPDSSRALDVHIARLRRLLEPDPGHPRLILTERGLGYRLG